MSTDKKFAKYKASELKECFVRIPIPYQKEGEARDGIGQCFFGRIPMAGEYISVKGRDCLYLVRHVVHCAEVGDHLAELYVEKALDTKTNFGDPMPPGTFTTEKP